MAEYFIEISKSAKVNVRENFLVDFDENYDRSVFFTFAGDQNLSVAIPVVGGAWCIVDSAGTALDNCEVDDDLQFQLMNLLSLMGASVRVPGHILGISSPFRTSNLYKYYDLLIRESV